MSEQKMMDLNTALQTNIKITIYPPLANRLSLADGLFDKVSFHWSFDGTATLSDVIDRFVQLYGDRFSDDLRKKLQTDHKGLAIAINGVMVHGEEQQHLPLKEEAEVTVLPIYVGG